MEESKKQAEMEGIQAHGLADGTDEDITEIQEFDFRGKQEDGVTGLVEPVPEEEQAPQLEKISPAPSPKVYTHPASRP